MNITYAKIKSLVETASVLTKKKIQYLANCIFTIMLLSLLEKGHCHSFE